ncbi:hypothetical protein [Streptomyces sp. NPDC048357]|uniref:hypothetical protein n=1 Tax=Streptomyces sp. NPDC048357 TaxID=3154719 RepID=UPI003419BDBA
MDDMHSEWAQRVAARVSASHQRLTTALAADAYAEVARPQDADPRPRMPADSKQGPFAGCSPAGGHVEPSHGPLPVDPYDLAS